MLEAMEFGVLEKMINFVLYYKYVYTFDFISLISMVSPIYEYVTLSQV